MEIILYKTNSESERMTKSLTANRNISGHLLDDCDILNPNIEFKYVEGLESYNYAYIPKFKRYYYLDKPIFSGNTLIYPMHVDAVASWKNDILASYATITRTNKGNKYLNDNRISTTAKHTFYLRQIGRGFTNKNSYVIVIASGGGLS